MAISILTYSLLFGLSFLVIPIGWSQFEVPKTLAAILLISILGIFSLITSPKSLLNIKLIFFLLLTGLSFYHLLFPVFPDHLLWGNFWRPQGTLLYLSLFLFFLIAHKLPFNLKLYSRLAFYSLIILLVFTLVIGPTSSFRFAGPLGEANSLGAMVLFLFPLALFSGKRKDKTISAALAVILILLSGSRSAILGFLAEAIILFLLKFKKIFLLATLGIIFIYVFAFILPFLPHNIPEQYFLRFESRVDIWSISFWAGFDNPILGTGFGSIQDAIKLYATKIDSLIQYQSVDSAHNLFLNFWLTGGIVGLISLILIIILSIKNLIRTQSWTLLSILIGLLIVQSFNPVSAAVLVQFWWILGISSQADQMS